MKSTLKLHKTSSRGNKRLHLFSFLTHFTSPTLFIISDRVCLAAGNTNKLKFRAELKPRVSAATGAIKNQRPSCLLIILSGLCLLIFPTHGELHPKIEGSANRKCVQGQARGKDRETKNYYLQRETLLVHTDRDSSGWVSLTRQL